MGRPAIEGGTPRRCFGATPYAYHRFFGRLADGRVLWLQKPRAHGHVKADERSVPAGGSDPQQGGQAAAAQLVHAKGWVHGKYG